MRHRRRVPISAPLLVATLAACAQDPADIVGHINELVGDFSYTVIDANSEDFTERIVSVALDEAEQTLTVSFDNEYLEQWNEEIPLREISVLYDGTDGEARDADGSDVHGLWLECDDSSCVRKYSTEGGGHTERALASEHANFSFLHCRPKVCDAVARDLVLLGARLYGGNGAEAEADTPDAATSRTESGSSSFQPCEDGWPGIVTGTIEQVAYDGDEIVLTVGAAESLTCAAEIREVRGRRDSACKRGVGVVAAGTVVRAGASVTLRAVLLTCDAP
jgi:hypothetical protein